MSWVVLLRTGDRPDDVYAYGPLAEESDAKRYATFLTNEVDPARAYELEDPVRELLAYYSRQEVKT